MVGTEIVKTPNHIHTGLQGFRLTNQSAGPPSQAIKTLAKGGVEPFNVSGVYATLALASLDQVSNLARRAI